jgi:SAM-dependent methyltransferase
VWFDPDELLIQQAREIQEVDSGRFQGKGHFGAYYALLKGNRKWVTPHSTADDRVARSVCREVHFMIGARAKRVQSVLDIGCGVGAITNAWKHFLPEATVTGIDISEAAITYARQRYPACKFLSVGVSGDTDLGIRFDLVHCKAFYPFVRTADVAVHLKYLGTCVRHLAPGGLLVLVHPDQRESINMNLKEGHIPHDELRLSKFEEYPISLWPFRDCLPYSVASRLSAVAARLTGRYVWKAYIAIRQ